MKLYLKKQLTIAIFTNIGIIIVGYVMGWTAPVIPKLQDPEKTPLAEPITDGQSSLVGSLLYVGTILGPYVTGYLSNVIGRKPCLILGALTTMLAFVIQAFATNLAMVYTGRVFSGLGVGIVHIVSIVYIGEIASTSLRGILLTGTGIFSTFGTLLIYSIGPFVSYAATSYVGIALTFIYVIGLFFIPETPVFHVLKGKEKSATETLVALGREEDINKVLESKLKVSDKKSRMKEWSEIFTKRINRKTLFITLTLGALQQMSGVVAVMFFATSIFMLAGSSIEPNVATIIIGIAQIIASCITPCFIERAGRKTLLLISTGFCFLSLFVLGIFFYLDNTAHPAVESIKWLPLVTLIIFFMAFDFGFGIMPGTLTGEMFLPNVRSTGSTLTITFGWFVGFWVSTTFNSMLQAFGGDVTFWIFSGACALAFVFTLVCVPETRGKSLLEINEMLDKKGFLYLSFR